MKMLTNDKTSKMFNLFTTSVFYYIIYYLNDKEVVTIHEQFIDGSTDTEIQPELFIVLIVTNSHQVISCIFSQ